MSEEKNIPPPEMPETPPESGYESAPETTEEIKTPEQAPEDFSVDIENLPEVSSPSVSSAAGAAVDEKEIARHAEELKVHERPRQVEMLAGLALEKGVPHAVAIAKKLDGYSLDALHDALVDDLYAELKKRGLVKEL